MFYQNQAVHLRIFSSWSPPTFWRWLQSPLQPKWAHLSSLSGSCIVTGSNCIPLDPTGFKAPEPPPGPAWMSEAQWAQCKSAELARVSSRLSRTVRPWSFKMFHSGFCCWKLTQRSAKEIRWYVPPLWQVPAGLYTSDVVVVIVIVIITVVIIIIIIIIIITIWSPSSSVSIIAWAPCFGWYAGARRNLLPPAKAWQRALCELTACVVRHSERLIHLWHRRVSRWCEVRLVSFGPRCTSSVPGLQLYLFAVQLILQLWHCNMHRAEQKHSFEDNPFQVLMWLTSSHARSSKHAHKHL